MWVDVICLLVDLEFQSLVLVRLSTSRILTKLSLS